ncbi:MAG TPA: COX15/CtaA family protein [Chitinophagaceae bacterium]|nr:COX15/CtaA family protein [Chitinophagaceae bacterium]
MITFAPAMKDAKKYLRYTWFVLVMVFLVILAGGVVRMTQSGMGCPDWPKCFGRWIPPTQADQLPPDFEKYLKKQDIDHTFNAYHTWIEYINRLLGALLGVFIFIHFVWSFIKFRKLNSRIVWLSFLLLVAVGFQGWLGKKVVDDNLAVVKVTTHMLVALVIAAIPLLIINRLQIAGRVVNKVLKNLSVIVILFLLIQIILGTQVREQIDEISRALKYDQRELWISRLDNWFFIHRSFSWLVAIICILLWWKARPFPVLHIKGVWIMGIVLLSITSGVIMAYYNIPALAQPLHLLLASILVITVFSFRLRLK